MGDSEVVDRLAVLLDTGYLHAHWKLQHVTVSPLPFAIADSTAKPIQTQRRAPSIPADRDIARQYTVWPRPLRHQAAHKPIAEGVAPLTEGISEKFDQDAQAATLRLAAENGTPFCEICEERKRGRKKPGGAGVSA